MALQFKPATKSQARLRLGLLGPAGAGKTYSALRIASVLGTRIAVIDTEHGSASKYANEPGMPPFDVLELDTFSPQTYIDALKAAEQAGYEVCIVDSLSHAWMGKDGALEMVDKAAKRSGSGNSYTAWRDVTPIHNAMVEALLQSRCHLIVTLRVKMEYVLETNAQGKQVPRKVGLAPIQREGLEYTFDVVADLDLDHTLIVTKTRCSTLNQAIISNPGSEFGEHLKAWLTDGAPMPEPSQAAPPRANGHPPALQSRDKPTRVPESQAGHPTHPQLIQLFKLKTEHGISDEALKLQLTAYGVESTKDLSLEQYQALCDWIEAQGDVPDGLVPGSDEAWAELQVRATAAGLLPEGWERLREQDDYAAAEAHVRFMEQQQREREQPQPALEV